MAIITVCVCNRKFSLFELSQRGGDADIVTQQVKGGDEVTPLHQFPQGTPAEGILCDLEPRLLCQQAQMHQDLSGMRRHKVFRHIKLTAFKTAAHQSRPMSIKKIY